MIASLYIFCSKERAISLQVPLIGEARQLVLHRRDRSARSWAGINPLDHVAQDVLPYFDDGESETDLSNDDDPFRRTLILGATGSDGLQPSVTLAAILYFGGQENFIDQSVATQLDAPIKRHPAVEFQGSDGKHFEFEMSVSLNVRLRDEPETTETEFLIMPYMGDHEPLSKVLFEWLRRKGFQIKFTSAWVLKTELATPKDFP